MTLPRFLVSQEALDGRTVSLTGSELHHLRVRRLHAGSTLVLFDGLGRHRQGVVTALDRRQASIQFVDEEPARPESGLRLVLAQAALKAGKLDLVIEKATELGASEVVIFTCERSVPSPTAVRVARWNRIAASAAKQCQRSTVPNVRGPITFDELLRERTDALQLLFWEDAPIGTLQTLADTHQRWRSLVAVVGPEGGFSSREATRALAAGFQPIRLAEGILRAETAAIVAVALSQFLWGNLGAAAQPHDGSLAGAPRPS